VRRYTVADVFTDRPLAGNQVAVYADGSGLSPAVMQMAAREMNLSETVFVLPPSDSSAADARVRIFTPAVELPFAGHPVLGTAFVLGLERGGSVIRLETGVGVIPVALVRDDDGAISFGEMEQMLPVEVPLSASQERDLLAALGVERSGSLLPVEAYRNGPTFVYVELDGEAAVASLRPDMVALEELGTLGVSCFAVSSQRVKMRMFGPGLGVPEDPATGSAAGPLGVHLVRHGRAEPGPLIEIHQGAEIGRPSSIRVRIEGSAERIERVLVGGSAGIVAHGDYRLE
jgi:trans-2,3-dihydro-3-hydroxyanthranilate isomerase